MSRSKTDITYYYKYYLLRPCFKLSVLRVAIVTSRLRPQLLIAFPTSTYIAFRMGFAKYNEDGHNEPLKKFPSSK